MRDLRRDGAHIGEREFLQGDLPRRGRRDQLSRHVMRLAERQAEPPPGSGAAVPKTVSVEPSPAVAPPRSGGLGGEPLGLAYQTSVPDQVVVPGTGRKSFPLDPLL
ncbi:MAG: hypothetical protein NVSMB26_27400 [Beijerinckiaceae bacterium]